jgi:molybdopterin-guanine dinucleotide biosynthesis protein A
MRPGLEAASDRPERAGGGERTSDLVLGVVLCGGASRRMGRDKAELVVEGRTLLERAAATLASVAHEVVLACGPEPRYAHRGLELVLDRVPGGGPLAGLEAGLARLAERGDGSERPEHPQCPQSNGWLVALACDMPRADARVLALLLERARARDLDVCLLASPDGLEPLCAVYRASCLEPVRAALAAGERRMVAFHGRVAVGVLHTDELAPLGAELAGSAANLNTPEELAAELSRGTEGRP